MSQNIKELSQLIETLKQIRFLFHIHVFDTQLPTSKSFENVDFPSNFSLDSSPLLKIFNNLQLATYNFSHLNKHIDTVYFQSCRVHGSISHPDRNIVWGRIFKTLSEQYRILRLTLYLSNIDDSCVKVLCQNMRELRTLELGHNMITDQGAILIARTYGKRLVKLNLWSNSVGDQGTLEICRECKSLKWLSLMSNRVTLEGALPLFIALAHLEYLSLQVNNLEITKRRHYGRKKVNTQYLTHIQILFEFFHKL